MDQNPYKPSDAVISRATRKRTPRPKKPIPDSVRWAVGIYVVCFILYFVTIANLPTHTIVVTFKVPPHSPPMQPPSETYQTAMRVLPVTIGFGGPAFFLWNVLRRQNWARIALALLTLLILSVSGGATITWYFGGLLDAVILVAAAAMVLVSVVLLFIPSSNEWFRTAADEE